MRTLLPLTSSRPVTACSSTTTIDACSPLPASEALDCFELATAREPESAEAWAGLSLLYTDRLGHGLRTQAEVRAASRRPRESGASRPWTSTATICTRTWRLADVQFFSGADFRDVAERVLRTWPENAEAQGFIGAMFVLTGETDRGSALVERAIESTPKPPSGYYASRCRSGAARGTLSTTRSRRRCVSIPRIGRLVSSCSRPRPRWPAARTLRCAPGAACWSWIRASRRCARRSAAVARRAGARRAAATRARGRGGSEVGAETDQFRLRSRAASSSIRALHLGRELLKPCRRWPCGRAATRSTSFCEAVDIGCVSVSFASVTASEVQRQQGLNGPSRGVPRTTEESCQRVGGPGIFRRHERSVV